MTRLFHWNITYTIKLYDDRGKYKHNNDYFDARYETTNQGWKSPPKFCSIHLRSRWKQNHQNAVTSAFILASTYSELKVHTGESFKAFPSYREIKTLPSMARSPDDFSALVAFMTSQILRWTSGRWWVKLRKAAVSSVVDHREGGPRGNYNVYESLHYCIHR